MRRSEVRSQSVRVRGAQRTDRDHGRHHAWTVRPCAEHTKRCGALWGGDRYAYAEAADVRGARNGLSGCRSGQAVLVKRSLVATFLILAFGALVVPSVASALPNEYWVDVHGATDGATTTSEPYLGGSGSLTASGTGNVNYGAAKECRETGADSVNYYPPLPCSGCGVDPGCKELGRPFASPENEFWFTGNETCAAHHPPRPYSGSVFTWHVQLPQTGYWRVEAYIPFWTNGGQGDTYTLTANEGQAQYYLGPEGNQEAYYGQWTSLFERTHQFTAGQEYTVTLGIHDSQNGFCKYQLADRMKWVYVRPADPPAVETGAASSAARTSATLNATVNPNGGEVSACDFEYGTSSSYGASAPCSPSPGSETSPVAVSSLATDLIPSTIYHFRIVATNATGTSYGADRKFTTLGAPDFGRCVKVAAEERGKKKVYHGGYTAATCLVASELHNGEYEWEPGVAKTGFKTERNGVLTLETSKKLKVTCSAESSGGEIVGTKEVANIVVRLTGCGSSGQKCTTPGLAEGVLESKVLEGALGWEMKARKKVALDLRPVKSEAVSGIPLHWGKAHYGYWLDPCTGEIGQDDESHVNAGIQGNQGHPETRTYRRRSERRAHSVAQRGKVRTDWSNGKFDSGQRRSGRDQRGDIERGSACRRAFARSARLPGRASRLRASAYVRRRQHGGQRAALAELRRTQRAGHLRDQYV